MLIHILISDYEKIIVGGKIFDIAMDSIKYFSFYRASFFSIMIWEVVSPYLLAPRNINRVMVRRHIYCAPFEIVSFYFLKNFAIKYKLKVIVCSYSYDSILSSFKILDFRWKLEVQGS